MHPSATLRGTIIGFVCATRCESFTAESMKTHDATGKLLAIHSVVVQERYRNHGVASAMLQDYLLAMEKLNEKGNSKANIEKIVLIAKKKMLAFYVRNGFVATGVSPIVHGKEEWFQLDRSLASAKSSDADTYECYLVDSFADVEKKGSGNPAAVVILNDPPGVTPVTHGGNAREGSLDDLDEDDDEDDAVDDDVNYRGVKWCSTVAKEFNQSETAFVWPLSHLQTDTPTYAIRYYTRSGVEVELCGHATLAAACCLFQQVNSKRSQKLAFLAKNDNLQAELCPIPASNQSTNSSTCNSSNASRIVMQFPWKNVTPVLSERDRNDIFRMSSRAFLGNTSDQSLAFITRHVIHIGTTDGMEDLFMELTEEGFDSLLGVKIGHSDLIAWEGYSRGVIVCCVSSGQTTYVDFRSRFFGPKVGIDEDPVTGSAHCSLGPYFGAKLGKSVVVGRQESERGGLVECMLKQEEGRVYIVGSAVMVFSGQLSMRM